MPWSQIEISAFRGMILGGRATVKYPEKPLDSKKRVRGALGHMLWGGRLYPQCSIALRSLPDGEFARATIMHMVDA